MENKDQLNQIPEESKNEIQDEKTSQQETDNVEVPQQAIEKQAEEVKVVEEQDKNQPPAEPKEEVAVETPAQEIVEPASEEEPAPVDEKVVETSEEGPVSETNAIVEIEEEVVTEKEVSETPATIETKEEVVVEKEVSETPATVETKEEVVAENEEAEVTVETPAPETIETATEEVPAPVDEKVVETGEEVPVSKITALVEIVKEIVVEKEGEEPTVETKEELADETPVAEKLKDETGDKEAGEVVDEVSKKVDYNELPRNELIEALEILVQADDVNKIKSKIALIKVSYLKKTKEDKAQRYQSYLDEGGDKEDYKPTDDPLEGKFNELFNIYKQKRSIFLENLEKEKVENLAKKQVILDNLKELIGSEETLKKTYDDFKELQDSWKAIGMVPQNELNNLWQNYHFLVEKFFDKVKINRELRDLDLKKNLEQKIVFCEKAEELLLETSILKSFKELQRLHEQWKEIGPAPEDKRDEIWDRFKSATEKINLRRREHYKKQQDEQENNLIAKTALCEKAESLFTEDVDSIREWQAVTKNFTDLFNVWKTIGPAPRKQNDEIWERFKTSLDSFYTDKKEYFGKLKEQQVNNYNLKLDLCAQAESLKDSNEWRTATRDLISLQKEWRDIGPVPRKNSDKIWKRFRTACDEFFNRKTDHFSNIRGEESENLKKKEELIKQVEEYDFDGSKGDNLGVLKDFQRQWTEIGFVPFKEKDRLQNTFRDVINKQLDKLNISDVEMSMASYKSRFEIIKDSSEGQRQVYRERIFIQNKLVKMQEDILLWENNLGFLAASKKASLLKDEFDKKIVKAKNEVDVLKAKLKFLDK